MKRIFTILLMLCASIAFSQNAPITFETGAHGNTWTWTTFENGTNPPPAQVVANPSATGINTSATVLKMTMQTTGQPWAGVESSHGAGIGSFTLSASNAIVKIMVYKPVISDVAIKFATPSGGSTGELKVANTLINQWEELTFNFSSKIGEVNDQIIIFLDFQARTTTNVCYFDNITFSAATINTDPTVAAPTPTKAANQVISMFSNAYTNVTVDTWRTSWSNATLTDLQIVGNDTKKYSALDFVGIETVVNQINADTMQNFNIDVWTANVTTFKIKLVDFGANAAFGGGDDKEHELSFTPTLNQWNTFSIPLSNFTNLTTRGHIAQLIFVGLPTGTGTVFIDNVYFSKSAPVVTAPTVAAPTPTKPANQVISMFSNAYTNVTVDTWRTSWSNATLTDTTIVGNNTKKYSALDFVGIETVVNQINADTMQNFNIDVWTTNVTTFKIKLVDFGANAAFGGGDDKEHELTFTPVLNQWNTFSIPLSNFINLTTRGHIAQLILVGQPTAAGTVFIDNVYFSKSAPVVTAPSVAAPTPTKASNLVISMFSNAYTNVTVDTWRTSWSNATLTDTTIVGNDTKKYSALDFVGIETVVNQINADSMQNFNIDVWTANLTAFKVKLVDFGANAAFGGGDDKEHELSFTPTLNQWNTLSIPLSDFTNLTTRGHIAQLILVGQPTGSGTVFIDNVYFSKASAPVIIAPTTAAPTPTKPSTDVISMFSNAYTNVNVDTWRTSWSNATLVDTTILGNDTKKYANLDFVGIETTGPNMINATDMTSFHMNVWTNNATTFRIKLVDFGANGAFGGGDDTEHELAFTPALNTWNSYDILLTDFVNLTTKGHIAQLILSAVPAGSANVFIDNVYFSKTTVVLEPTTAAPSPTSASNNVISMFSNKYTNVAIDTWRTSWSSAVLTEMQIQGNDTKKYTSLDFVGVESTGPNLINASGMDTFHVDMWTPNITTFRVKLVDFGADAAFGGGDDKEHELLFTPGQNQWISLHIPFTDFTGLTTRSHIAQLIFSAIPSGLGTVYIDNVYFSKKPLVGVNNNENANISIYPNPSTDVLHFAGLNVNETNQVSIFDLQGKLVESYELTGNASIDIRNLNKGMYLVKVANHVARIVKM